MDVEILALCDAATESGNKINILGIFDEVKGEAEPLRVHCSIGGRVRFDRAEAGRKQVNLRIRDDAGTEVFVATSEVEVSVKPNGVVAMQFAFALPILILPHFGRYAVDLL